MICWLLSTVCEGEKLSSLGLDGASSRWSSAALKQLYSRCTHEDDRRLGDDIVSNALEIVKDLSGVIYRPRGL